MRPGNGGHHEGEAPGGRSKRAKIPSEYKQQKQPEQFATSHLHAALHCVNVPIARRINGALDVMVLLAETLGDMPQEQYNAQLAGSTVRTLDIIIDAYRLAEDNAALGESEEAA